MPVRSKARSALVSFMPTFSPGGMRFFQIMVVLPSERVGGPDNPMPSLITIAA